MLISDWKPSPQTAPALTFSSSPEMCKTVHLHKNIHDVFFLTDQKLVTKSNGHIKGHQKVNFIIASTLMSKMGFRHMLVVRKKQDRKNNQIYQYVARVNI